MALQDHRLAVLANDTRRPTLLLRALIVIYVVCPHTLVV